MSLDHQSDVAPPSDTSSATAQSRAINATESETSGNMASLTLDSAATEQPADSTPTVEPETKASIIVVGSANIDETLSVSHIVRPGETIAAKQFSRQVGGKGANQAVGAARAGAAVTFVGAIGRDGAEMQQALHTEGIHLDFLQISDDLPTGRAIIQITPDGQNSIIIQAGANFTPDLPIPTFNEGAVVLLQNEIPLERTISVIRDANKAGAIVVFNPSPMPSAEERSSIPWELIDWLIVNEVEAPMLGYHLCQRPGGTITTFGRRGAQIKLRHSDETVHKSAGLVAKSGIVDTTGAGDCFTVRVSTLFHQTSRQEIVQSYFAALLLKLKDPRSPTAQERGDLLTIANQAAAMSCEKKGATYGVPLLYQVKERIASTGQPWPIWAD